MKAAAVAVCLVFLAPPARAWQEPSLAEVAQREKERRVKAKPPTKVLTDDDLGSSRSHVQVLVDAEAKAQSEGQAGKDGKPAKTGEELRADKRADYQRRIEEQQTKIASFRKQVAQVQLDMNDLTSYLYGSKRADLQRMLEEGQKQIAEAEKAIADIEEQARREGFAVSR